MCPYSSTSWHQTLLAEKEKGKLTVIPNTTLATVLQPTAKCSRYSPRTEQQKFRFPTNVSLTSPVLNAEKVAEIMGHKGRDFLQVMSADPGGEQGLVCIPECGVHQEQTPMLANGFGKANRALTEKDVPET